MELLLKFIKIIKKVYLCFYCFICFIFDLDKYEILSDIKLKGGFHSGYHDTYISLLYKGNTSRVLCKGEYELWWVQRTRSNFIIERTKVFNVTRPECDWDYINNRYYIYATVKEEKEIIEPPKPSPTSPFE